MNRRDFLIHSALAAGGASVIAGASGRLTAASVSRGQAADPAKLARVAIMTYSFDRIIRMPGRPEDPARTLELFDIPEMYADRYRVHHVEVQHNHFASTESSYFRDFRARLAKVKSQVTNINLEFDAMSITAADPVLRAQAVDLTKQWIDHAVELGSPRVMVNQGRPTPENQQIAIATLKAMGDYAKSRKVMVSMEPRGGGGGRGRTGGAGVTGLGAGAAASAPGTPTTSAPAPVAPATPPSANPPAPAPAASAPAAYIILTEIIKRSGTYANVDLGNFGDQETQHAGMRAMFPLTVGNCHVKLNPARYDLPAALALARELGYKGLYSIEAGGAGDPYENVQKIYDVLTANI